MAEELGYKFRPKVALGVILVGCLVGLFTRYLIVGNRPLDDYLSTLWGLVAIACTLGGLTLSVLCIQVRAWGILNVGLFALAGGLMWVIPLSAYGS